ncbi:hypothetical protein TRVL_07510 [Trypanosoma vivax]|nr:hypothetical protein TRVL_07510 [Trypanosoma vivax]
MPPASGKMKPCPHGASSPEQPASLARKRQGSTGPRESEEQVFAQHPNRCAAGAGARLTQRTRAQESIRATSFTPKCWWCCVLPLGRPLASCPPQSRLTWCGACVGFPPDGAIGHSTALRLRCHCTAELSSLNVPLSSFCGFNFHE